MGNHIYIKSLVKNSSAILSMKVTTVISLFILAIIVARLLGPLEFGKYSTIIAFYCIFELVSFLGLENLVIREIAKDTSQASKFLSNCLVLGFLSTGLCFLLMFTISQVMNYSIDIKRGIYIMGISLFPSFGNLLCESIFISLEKAKYAFYVYLIREIGMLSASLIILFLGFGVYPIFLIFVITKIIGLILFLYFLSKNNVHLISHIDFNFLQNIIKLIMTFILISIFANIFLEIDILLVSKIKNMVEVGLFSAAKKIVRIGLMSIFSFITALFPFICRSFNTPQNQPEYLYGRFIKYISILIFPLIIIVTFFSSRIISLFFGYEFNNSAIALNIMIWSAIPWSISFLLSRILIATNHQNKDLQSLLGGLLSMVVLGIFLTYRWGFIGTSYAYLISMIILAILHYWFVRKYVFKFSVISLMSKPFISMIIMGMFTFLFRQQNPYLVAFISVLLYFSFLLILKALSREDMIFLKMLQIENLT